MALEVRRDLRFNFIGDADKLAAATKTAESKLSKLGKGVDKLSKRMVSLGKSLTASVTLPLAAAAGAAVNLASDLSESQSKFDTVFGDFAKDAQAAFGKSFPKSVGLSSAAALDLTATLGNVITGMGFTKERAAELSPPLIQLAADLASFNNVPVEQAAQAVISGLTGEREALKSLGIVLSEADVQQRALEMGLWGGVGALNASAKALATQSLLFEKAGPAVGDFERTSGGLANQSRILKAQLTDVAAQIGTNLLPLALKAANMFSTWLERFKSLTPEQQKLIIKIAAIAAAVGPVLIVGGKLLALFKAIAVGFKAMTAVLSANPYVLLIAATVALVVLIVKNWDKIKAAAAAVRDFIVDVWNNVVDFFKGVPGRISAAVGDLWGGIRDGFRAAINRIIQWWNNLSFTIGGGSFLGIDVPSVTFSTPNIPLLHTGGVFRAPMPGGEGLAILKDKEVVLTPEQVEMLRPVTAQTGGITVQFQGPVFGLDDLETTLIRTLDRAAQRGRLSRAALRPT